MSSAGSETVPPRPAAVGRVDPLVAGRITGWAEAGSTIVLRSEEGVELGRDVAARPRARLAMRADGGARGFVLALPDTVLASPFPVLRVEYEDGRPVPGSPLRVLDVSVAGRITGVEGDVIRGTVEVSSTAFGHPVAVAAVVDGEVVAIAPADAAGPPSRRGFVLLLPDGLAASGQRLVQVAVIGGHRWLDGSPAVLARAPSDMTVVRERQRPVTLAIKIAAPNFRAAQSWGDYHFAKQIGVALQRRGWSVRVDCHDEWDRTGDDAVLVLRGRQRYQVRPGCVNMMWQISHPDRISDGEAHDYDQIFVASDLYAPQLRRLTGAMVKVLHQATDPTVFRPPEVPTMSERDVLFVGNSRRENRTLVKWCLETGVPLAVFGTMWDEIIPKKFLRGEYLANEDLHRWYGSCGILLNDHWDTMRDNGFLSNRLFDGSAAGAFIISDTVKGLPEIFGDAIETASDSKELSTKIAYFLAHPEERARRAAVARDIVLRSHTFDHRAEALIQAFKTVIREA